MNNGFDTALGPCQTHYSPVGRMKIPGEAIIRPVHGNYTALSLLTESALLYKNVKEDIVRLREFYSVNQF